MEHIYRDAEKQTFSACDCALRNEEARRFGTDQSLDVVCISFLFFSSAKLREIRERGISERRRHRSVTDARQFWHNEIQRKAYRKQIKK